MPPKRQLTAKASDETASSVDEEAPSTVYTPRSTGKTKLSQKTKPTACRRCHARKVKCSGGQPCENCRRASKASECSYPRRKRLVKVSQQYLDDLLAENQRLRNAAASAASSDVVSRPSTTTLVEAISSASTTSTIQPETSPSAIQAPSIDDRPWFFDLKIPHTPILIGEASDVAFATRFRQAISDRPHNHIPRVNYATDERLLTLSNVNCPWPSPSRARLLVNVALKYVSRCYHIVRRSLILEGLEQALLSPASCDSLFKAKLWALFAIGEMYSTRMAAEEKNFPGTTYFAKATHVLQVVSERPRIDAIEVRLLLSFFSLALNRRYSAYALAGSAVRLSIVMGLHYNVPESQLSDPAVREHRIRVWWTAYSFDRMWAAKLGHPVAVQDHFIEVDFPSDPKLTTPSDDFADAAYLVASLQLARLSGRIVHSIYDRRSKDTSLAQRVQEALRDLRAWVEELPSHLHIDSTDDSDARPKPVSLHLYFNQCAISATRPILLHVLRTHVASWSTQSSPEQQIPASALALAEACVRCARHSCRLLIDCWVDGSFATFDYFYTHYLFSAGTILAISSMLDSKESRSDKEQFDSAAQFLEQLKSNGNFAAKEVCHHLHAMKEKMAAARERKSAFEMAKDASTLMSDELDPLGLDPLFPTDTATAGMALSEPSLQELLEQPMLDLQFIDASLYQEGSQSLYWPDINSDTWPTDAWTPT